MALFVEQVANGLTLGAFYALVAVGLALVFGVARLVNFAHGEFFMVGAYILYFSYAQAHLPYGVAVVLGVVLMGLFGALFHTLIYQPVMHRVWYVQLIATLAASFLLANTAIIALGSTSPTSVCWCSGWPSRPSWLCSSSSSAHRRGEPCERSPRTARRPRCWASSLAG
jgi:branched-subunit amino acid ABC-type transport system permease component